MRSVAFACIVATLFVSGCASTFVYEKHSSGKSDPWSRTYDYSSMDFDVLGPVEATGESTVILGLVSQGHEGYGLLMKNARSTYGKDVSSVMFIFADYEYQGILYPVFGTVKTTYAGTAVRLKTVSHTPNVRVQN